MMEKTAFTSYRSTSTCLPSGIIGITTLDSDWGDNGSAADQARTLASQAKQRRGWVRPGSGRNRTFGAAGAEGER